MKGEAPRFVKVKTSVWLVGMLFLVASCGGDGDSGQQAKGDATTAKKDAPAQQAAAVDAATAGAISGRVMLCGDAPEMTVIDVSSEATCHAHAETDPVYTQNVVVNDDGSLRNVFVYVKSGLEGMDFPVPTTPVVLDQVGCTYEPHVFGIQAKQPLLIKNSDEGVLHNIHTLSQAGNSFNFGMPKIMESKKKFKKAEVMVEIKCDVHGWMNGYAGVMDHPYYGVTGADGSFKLSPLPPGEYTIEAWHEEYGTQTQTVTIGEKETKELTFTFEASSE